MLPSHPTLSASQSAPSSDDSGDDRGEDGVRASQPGPMEFDELVHLTGRRFHRAALLLTGGDHHLAEDLLQTTYAKVYSRWFRVARADDPVAYTRTVLTNTFLSHRRLRRTARERPTDELPEPDPSYDDPAARVDLLAALARLRPRDRAVVVARYWFDRSVADVADELGMSDVAVRAASRRALGRLRLDLTGTGGRTDTDTPTTPNGDPS